MAKLLALFAVFRKGSALSNAEAWKGAQVATNVAALVIALGALAKAFGFDSGLTEEQALAIGGGVAAVASLVNGLLTVATTDKIGLPSVDDGGSTGRDQRDRNAEHSSNTSEIERMGG